MEHDTLGAEHFKVEALTADRDSWRKKVWALQDRVAELEMELENVKSRMVYCRACGAATKVGGG